MNWKHRCMFRLAIMACAVVTYTQSSTAQTISAESVLIRLIDEVDVPARAIGSLVDIDVEVGAVVEEGQLLAQIDDTEAALDFKRARYELEIAAREAENDVAIRSAMKTLAYSKAHYDRLYRADVAQPRSVSQSELEKARLDAEQAEFEMEKGKTELQNANTRMNLKANEVALAERNVEVRKILAPQSGVVVEVLRRAGEWVTPGEKIFRIVSTKRLRAEGFLKAGDVARDLKGAAVSVVPVFDKGPAHSFSGRITFVSPEIDPVNGQVRILAEVDNPDGILRPGLRARMSITGN